MGDRSAADGTGTDCMSTGDAVVRRRNALVLAVVLCLFPALILGALDWFMGSARRQAAAEPAIFAAQSADAVIARLGAPISAGWPIAGKVASRGGNGSAHLTIPLHGPKGSGRLEEFAQQQDKLWTACTAEFVASDGERIRLHPVHAEACTIHP